MEIQGYILLVARDPWVFKRGFMLNFMKDTINHISNVKKYLVHNNTCKRERG